MFPLTKTSFQIKNILGIFFAVLLLGVFLFYITFQARNLILGPEIILLEEPETVQHENTIVLKGITRNIVSLTLNGRSIDTDEQGIFERKLVLERGYTIMTLQAKDRYGRITTLSRPFVHSN